MARQNKSKFVSVIIWLLLLLLVVAGIGAVLHFTGIGKDDKADIDESTFRIEYGGEVYKADTENIIALPEKGKVRFEVKGTSSYSVNIVPNVTPETDFSYTVNGVTYKYGEKTDLSHAFDLKRYDGAFTIDSDDDYTLDSILSKLWQGDNKITIGKRGNFPAYKCEVISSTGETIDLLLTTCITGIKIPENIVF